MTVTQLEKEDGCLTENDQEKGNVLGDSNQCLCTKRIPEFHQRTNECVTDITFTEETVRKKLQSIQPDKPPGPDGLHPRVLKECSSSLAKPMYWIFRQSLETGQIPSDWKKALVTQILEKGSKAKAGNYLAISLTSISCNILEANIRETKIEFLNKNSIINPNQHGFMEGKSCLTNLSEELPNVYSPSAD